MHLDSAVVLAAGEGQRLRPLTRHRPKPMLPAGTRPILEYVLDALVNVGIEDIHLVVGYERGRVQNHFGSSYRGSRLTYHVQQKQLGSGHALLQARDVIDGDFLVVNGDEVLANEMIEAVLDAHTTDSVATLAVVESDEAPMYGAVELDGETVTDFVERPGDDSYRLLNAGVYAFDPSVFSDLESTPREAGELALTDAIVAIIERGGHVRGVRVNGLRSEVTYPWDLLALAGRLLDHGLVTEPEREAGEYVADSARIHEDATLVAPVVVGPDAVVEPGSVVGPAVAVRRNATVEAGATVRRSVLDTDCRLGMNATVADTVVGEGALVGPGATVPPGPSDVRVKNSIHEGQRLGCVLADRASLGGGATVIPGALIGPNAHVGPGVVVQGNVSEDTEVTR
ncbi:sugar phosphate nucleotidyltransferase [Halorarum salinum]|uniref:Bifunctional protein GlmU n=1 Tax=Halorarum salinum TaxID=2743089 RepID=A0A7D5L8Z7_9EURY|nr:sugar phosphate nucleotidyltransferase [Halobaculum salinum]QLG61106.1 NTP transferase domain-containing protein [Halobaculum salinum]